MSDEHDEGQCLHCFLQDAVEAWAKATGQVAADGAVTAGAEHITAGIGALIADMMAQAPDVPTAVEFMRQVGKDATQAYPVYRCHYQDYLEKAQLAAVMDETPPPRGKLH